MSDRSDKRFDATPGRKEKAKRDGNVARSAEIGGIAAFAAAALAMFACLPPIAAAALAALADAARRDVTLSLSKGDRQPALVTVLALACIPACAAAAGGTLAGLAQTGGLRARGLRLDLAALDPVRGLKRMLGGEAAVGAMRATLAFTAALAAMVPLGADVLGAASSLASPAAAAAAVVHAATRACIAALCVGAVFAVADYALAKRRWHKSIKMSFDELKRDAKENDGDPQARARRKSMHRSLVRGAIRRTREASFVIVNPTHVAVAVRYAPPGVPVPEILVRAAGEHALRVKALAREHAIPIVEDVALARLLYATGEHGRPIPPQTFVAVAQIIASLAREGVLA